MKLSHYPIQTLRDDPKEAEAVSHKLMLRAGFIRPLASGLYIYMPPMWRVLRKAEQIVREEMDRAGAIELRMPILSPRELWDQTGRWEDYTRGNNLFHLQDRKGSQLVLAPTHEEIITSLVANEVQSYRDLPVNFYHFSPKFRDEARPRGGLNRTREFPMKDAYSFDVDETGLDESYEKMRIAYIRAFKRCGLEFLTIEADPGAIGGTGSQEFMVRSESGEDQVITCDSCNYAANIETAISKLATPLQDEELKDSHIEYTPQIKTVEQLVELFNLPASQMVKTILYEVWLKGSKEPKVIAVLMRGDLDINEVKLGKISAKVLGGSLAELAIARPEVVVERTKAEVGFAGPIGLEGVHIIADESVRPLKNFLCGTNKTDYHMLDVNIGRDFPEPEYDDLRNAIEGDKCPRCDSGKIQITKGIELGHIFKLGTKYSRRPTEDNPTGLSATYLDKDGKEHDIVMGCYGIGITRIATSAIELYHDKYGMIWPITIAPWHIVIVVANTTVQEQMEVGNKLYEGLNQARVEAVLDDRLERIGFKLNDADLVGYPYKLIVGKTLKDGVIELKSRKTGEVHRLQINNAVEEISQRIQKELAEANQVG